MHRFRVNQPLAFLVLGVLIGAVAMLWLEPPAATAQRPINLKMQTAWPSASLLQENFIQFAATAGKMSAGRLKIETLPAGAVVGAFEVLDATNRGLLDGAHAAPGYWIGKHRAAIPLSHGPLFGMDFIDFFGWYHDGGGIELINEWYQQVLKMNVVSFPILPAGPQAMGWFRKPIKSFADVKGLKYRIYGAGAEVYSRLGISAVTLPGGEIVPAMERGVLDGADWVNCVEDARLGFHNVSKYHYAPGMHEPVTVGDLVINKTVYDKLPADLKEIISVAAQQTFWRWFVELQRKNAEGCQELLKQGVNVYRTPDELLKKFLETWDQIQKEDAAKDPFYAKVIESQKKYAGLVVPYRLSYWMPYELRAEHYWKDRVYLK